MNDLPVLEIQHLTVEAGYSDQWRVIVDDVSLTVHSGEVVALIGESGAGKSTVGLAALGFARQGTRLANGEIKLRGKDLLRMDAEERRQLRGHQLAYVSQSAMASLNPALTIGEQVAEPLVEHDVMTADEARSRAVELLALLRLPNPQSLISRYPHEVSGGQQQRIMIAMALACNPDLLILDEPTTALDVTTQIDVLIAIKNVIQLRSSAAIYISHDLAVVAQIAHRAAIMREGAVVEQASLSDLIERPLHAYTRSLLAAVKPSPRSSAVRTKEGADGQAAREIILRTHNISAGYRRWSRDDENGFVLRDVGITVKQGEVVALVGESGSGKSTLARVISGLLPPWTGKIEFAEQTLPAKASQRSSDQLRRIQIVFQSPETSLNPEERIIDTVGRPLHLFFKGRYRPTRARVENLLGMVGLESKFADRFPRELSGGQRQRISLARALAAEPDLILCDEVLSALDTVVAASVLDLLKTLQRRLQVAYLFISHDLATVASIADSLVVLYSGRVCEVGPTKVVFSPPHHPYTELLLESVPELRQGWLDEVVQKRHDGVQQEDPPKSEGGCVFFHRCRLRIMGICDRLSPPAQDFGGGHICYCHHSPERLLAEQLPAHIRATQASRPEVVPCKT